MWEGKAVKHRDHSAKVDTVQVLGMWVEGIATSRSRIKNVIFLPTYLHRNVFICCSIQWRVNELGFYGINTDRELNPMNALVWPDP